MGEGRVLIADNGSVTSESPSEKILSREGLLERRAAARSAGRLVVQCHGCFDLVHPGHVRHLQHAARQGDVLLVTVTADAGVGKGAGRPLFPASLRAENLAALDCVDWVYVNPEPTAEALLETVRPDVYIKGREYETNRDPRFCAEREAVERHGGRVVFSSGDIVFSSTALIAELERRADPYRERLAHLAAAGELDTGKLHGLVDGFSGRRVCVIGETILDTYVLCDRPDVASEGPMLSLRPLDHASYDGGAAMVARHIAAMGGEPVLVTALPRTAEAGRLRRRLEGAGVEVRWIDVAGPLLEKQRFLVGAQKVMKLDLVHPITLDATQQNELLTLAQSVSGVCEAAVFADFGQGLLSPGVLGGLTRIVRPRVGVLTGDVSGRRNALSRMRSLDLVCPTEHELREAMRDFDDSLNAVAWRCLRETCSRRLIVTLGADGLIAFDRVPDDEAGPPEAAWRTRVRGEHVPALGSHPVDTLGCGDALLAAATLSLAAGGSTTSAALLGSVAAAEEAGRLGNESVSAGDLRDGVVRSLGSRLAVASIGSGPRRAV